MSICKTHTPGNLQKYMDELFKGLTSIVTNKSGFGEIWVEMLKSPYLVRRVRESNLNTTTKYMFYDRRLLKLIWCLVLYSPVPLISKEETEVWRLISFSRLHN